jgi:rod shape-determining protein MreB and related proteins
VIALLAPLFRRLGRAFYVRFDAESIHVSQIGGRAGEWNDRALIATCFEGTQEKIRAIGSYVERARGEPGVQVYAPFAHPRVAIHPFQAAEALVRYGLTLVGGNAVGALVRPVVIMHPERRFAEGLTHIEERAIRECAIAAGAREVFLHEGSPLTRQGAAELIGR